MNISSSIMLVCVRVCVCFPDDWQPELKASSKAGCEEKQSFCLVFVCHHSSVLITGRRLDQAFMSASGRFSSGEDVIIPSFSWWGITHTHTALRSGVIISRSRFSLSNRISPAEIQRSFKEKLGGRWIIGERGANQPSESFSDRAIRARRSEWLKGEF